MALEIVAVGGYSVVGRNMTAVRWNDEVVILDCGLHVPNYATYTEEEQGDIIKLDEKNLKRVGAIPDDRSIQEWWPKVKAIVIGHAHLDHLGATPYLEHKYDAPIIATPFACAVLNAICRDERIKLKNQIRPLLPNSSMKVSPNITIEFIHVTHSTPQAVVIVVHTPDGKIVYGNDFKLDNSPTLGKKPNYEALQELGKEGKVKALIMDDLYAGDMRKMPSEAIAKDMLRDVLLGIDSKGKGLIVTTFSSHIARLKSITELGAKLGRKVVFVGRSIAKYAYAAEDSGVTNFTKMGVQILKYGRQVRGAYKEIMDNREKYMVVMTGHQGEPKAMMAKVLNNQYPFKILPEDIVVFSCITIPADVNKRNRAELERQLRSIGARIFTDIHVSGHCAREDLRDVITFVKPQHLVPTHGDDHHNAAFVTLANEQGYTLNKNLHVMKEQDHLVL